MKKDKLHDELNEHAPFLNDLRKKEDGLRVPEGYFDGLEDDVFRQLDAIGARRKPASFSKTKETRSWWQWLQSLWQPRTALAVAGVLAVAIAGWWYFSSDADQYTGQHLVAATISAEDAEAYLFDNVLEFEPNQIAMILPEDEWPPISLEPLNATTPQDATSPKHDLQISTEDLEDLLRDMTDEELEELL